MSKNAANRKEGLLRVSLTFVAAMICISAEARSEPVELPGGFEIGRSLDEAKHHASMQGWRLVRLSPELPGQWIVEGNAHGKIGLFVCGHVISGVHKYASGDLDEFARIVMELQRTHRKTEPDMQVATFFAGATRISNVDVRFADLDGLSVNVQLSSTDGRLGISTNYFRKGECPNPS
ncbi:hypothetical protein [Martelella radicis]|uniref:Uncharacterized protein n=1 Tax=Martelella radicis TaxID=1397476 RepID=A0A7W6KGQ7_9HYPH|nr:hypothetical protein [Martelella radicis]MBB4120931.1 hypothetical protein [Martelella radicis]